MTARRAGLLACLAVVVTVACYRTTRISASERNVAGHVAGGHPVNSFVLVDGREVQLGPFDTLSVTGDNTLIVIKRRTRPPRYDSLAVADIRHFTIRQFDGRRTFVAVIVVPIAVLGLLALAILASSCPFIYAWDGANFVPVAEPLGGAITPGLARTDLSELEGITADGGTYRIIVGNEIDETQHVDALRLVAVDHPAGTRVVADRLGAPRVVGAAALPIAARDQAGASVLPELEREDDHWWPARTDGPAFEAGRARDTLTLEFARPAADSATLLVHARTDLWGAYMLKRMLELWGGQVDQWYQLLDHSVATRAANEEWARREEMWVLRLWVKEDAGWAEQQVVVGGGPYLSETQAIPLDLSRVSARTVQLRLHPPSGYWRIGYAALAPASSVPSSIHELPVAEVAAPGDTAARDLLAQRDGRHLVMPRIGDRVELRFTAPAAPAPGMHRTVFARTSGWYRVHTARDAPRDAARLDSIWMTPGYPVDFARREYEAWRAANPRATLYPAMRAR